MLKQQNFYKGSEAMEQTLENQSDSCNQLARWYILNLETKLSWLEIANDKLADAHEQSKETDAAEQLQTTLNSESEFTDSVIGKISQLKLLKETVGRKKREMETTQSERLENRLTRMQQQAKQLQTAASG